VPVNERRPRAPCATEAGPRGERRRATDADTQSPAAPGTLTSTASMLVVRALVEAVGKLGGDSARFLSAAGFHAQQLETADVRVPMREVYRLCDLALDVTGDPALGLHWAELGTAFTPISHLMTQLIVHSKNIRQAFESLSRFGSLLSDELCYDLVEQRDRVILRCRLPSDATLRVRRFTAEMVVTSFFRILRACAAPVHIESVSFEYAPPAYHDEYARVFAGAARFEQPLTGIVFQRALLGANQPHTDEGIHEALQTLAERRVLRLAQHVPYALRVRELLIERGWPARMNMQAVARALGLSVRSLRRRLASEGRRYSELEHEAFEVAAMRLLQDRHRRIQEVARQMGFSDASTFHRAFKRATGVAPSARRGTNEEAPVSVPTRPR
jgi:AraC-like DNA-binding protein